MISIGLPYGSLAYARLKSEQHFWVRLARVRSPNATSFIQAIWPRLLYAIGQRFQRMHDERIAQFIKSSSRQAIMSSSRHEDPGADTRRSIFGSRRPFGAPSQYLGLSLVLFHVPYIISHLAFLAMANMTHYYQLLVGFSFSF